MAVVIMKYKISIVILWSLLITWFNFNHSMGQCSIAYRFTSIAFYQTQGEKELYSNVAMLITQM